MRPGIWFGISGDAPDLRLQPTPPGTRYLVDNDPALNPQLNPPFSLKERLRRSLGRLPRSPWHGSVGFPAITECWNGAILASRVGPSGSMVCFGGGHNDYFGSDVHRFDIDSREWTRELNGFTAGTPDDYGAGAAYPGSTYPDGSPLPPHTYGYVQYYQQQNDLLLLKGQTELGPNVKAVPIPHLLNLHSWRWRSGPKHPDAVFNSGGWTTWDPTRRRLWGHSGDDGGGNGLSWFSPDHRDHTRTVGRWGPRYPNKLPGRANHNAMQIDPLGDLIIVAAHADARIYCLDPDDPERPLVPLAAEGDNPPISPFSALEFSQRLDGILYFGAPSSPDVYLLKRPTADSKSALIDGVWRWIRIADRTAGKDPVADAARLSGWCLNPSHVFGRFRCVDYPGMTLAVLIRHVDSAVYAMRL